MSKKLMAAVTASKQQLGELIGTIGLGDAENGSTDILCRVYEYFLTQCGWEERRTVLHAALRGGKLQREMGGTS